MTARTASSAVVLTCAALSLGMTARASNVPPGGGEGCTTFHEVECYATQYCDDGVCNPSEGTCSASGKPVGAHRAEVVYAVGQCTGYHAPGKTCTSCSRIVCAKGKAYENYDFYSCEIEQCGWGGWVDAKCRQ